jgi:regulator of sirC expression with transglutaminase-like and TPR domain
LDLVYTEWQFNCESEKYFHTDNLMMHKVLRHHRGMPVSIGAVVLYLAASLDLPIYPVSFPTQLLLRVEISDESRPAYFINPWNGKKVNKQQMMQWLEGDLGFGSELKMEHLQIASMNTLEDRLETVFKMALTGEGKYEEALKVIQYRLILQPEDPYEIRDRGMILASLGCYQAAFDDINYFIDQCPDDPTALMLKLELPALERQSKACVIH